MNTQRLFSFHHNKYIYTQEEKKTHKYIHIYIYRNKLNETQLLTGITRGVTLCISTSKPTTKTRQFRNTQTEPFWPKQFLSTASGKMYEENTPKTNDILK